MSQLLFRYLLIITFGAIALLSACGSNRPLIEQCPADVPSISNDLKYEDIRANIIDLLYSDNSSEQVESYVAGLRGKQITWQGWINLIRVDKNGAVLIAIDMDEYTSDPVYIRKGSEYEGVRRIGLTDVIITESSTEIANNLRPGYPLVFSGIIEDLRREDDFVIDPGSARFAVIVSIDKTKLKEDFIPVCRPIISKQLMITLTRPYCSMDSTNCYTVGLMISDTGQVTYTKRDWGSEEIINQTGRIDKAGIQQLVEAFEQIDYFSLKDDYDSYDISDFPSSTTSITLNGRRKSIFHYYGDFSTPKELSELEQKIDEIINTEQYENMRITE